MKPISTRFFASLFTGFAASLTLISSLPVSAQMLGSTPKLIQDRTPVSSDNVTALDALQHVITPLQVREISLYEYEQSIRTAQDAIADAAISPVTTGVPQMQAALQTHQLALSFWKTCLVANSEVLCNETRPAVAEILKRYPKPQKIEEIAKNSPVESLSKVSKPWVNTRVRTTLREVVEYIPVAEQKKVLRLLWKQVNSETEVATNSLK